MHHHPVRVGASIVGVWSFGVKKQWIPPALTHAILAPMLLFFSMQCFFAKIKSKDHKPCLAASSSKHGVKNSSCARTAYYFSKIVQHTIKPGLLIMYHTVVRTFAVLANTPIESNSLAIARLHPECALPAITPFLSTPAPRRESPSRRPAPLFAPISFTLGRY